MEESKALFYTTIHSRWFIKSSVILFLNKVDILGEKILTSDLADYFPQFKGEGSAPLLPARGRCFKFEKEKAIPCLTLPVIPHLSPAGSRKQDAAAAMEFIMHLYLAEAERKEKDKGKHDKKTVYPHFTCATDTHNIRRVFSAIRDTVLLNSLKEFSLL